MRQVVLGEEVQQQRGPRASERFASLGSNASPSAKSRPRLHGTISCGNHSLAAPTCARTAPPRREPIAQEAGVVHGENGTRPARHRGISQSGASYRRVGFAADGDVPRRRTYKLFGHHFAVPSHADPGGWRSRRSGGARLDPRAARSRCHARRRGHRSGRRVVPQRPLDRVQDERGDEPVLLAQFPLLEDALRALGVPVWAMVEYEADDALASAAPRLARGSPRRAGLHLHARQGPRAVRRRSRWSCSSIAARSA